jgi:hypothetical protein
MHAMQLPSLLPWAVSHYSIAGRCCSSARPVLKIIYIYAADSDSQTNWIIQILAHDHEAYCTNHSLDLDDDPSLDQYHGLESGQYNDYYEARISGLAPPPAGTNHCMLKGKKKRGTTSEPADRSVGRKTLLAFDLSQ